MGKINFNIKGSIKKIALLSITVPISIGVYVKYYSNHINNNISTGKQETTIIMTSPVKQVKPIQGNNKIAFKSGNISNSNIEVGNNYTTTSPPNEIHMQSVSESKGTEDSEP